MFCRVDRVYSIYYSQNFLKSSDLIQRLVKKSTLSNSDLVIEIGTGRGKLTKELAKASKKVITCEIDERLYSVAKNNLKNFKNINLLNINFLKFDLPKTPYKVFANIPFNLTAEIIKKLFDSNNPPNDTYLVMQKEAADKFIGNPRETQASLILKAQFEMKTIYTFNKYDFEPYPSVGCVLVRFKKREKPLINTNKIDEYKKFITFATSQWKATLKESLKILFTKKQIQIISDKNKIDLNIKPLDLDIDKWIILFNLSQKIVDKNKRTKNLTA